MDSSKDSLCYFCSTSRAKYCCSRCHRRYCSSKCYQCPDHMQCSEDFFKQCVTQELLSQKFDESSKRKLMGILAKNDKQFLDDLISGKDIDSDDNENDESLDSRFEDMNIDDLSDIWNKLNDSERKQFNELVKSGEIGEFVELWTPWWANPVAGRPLITPLDDSTNEENPNESDDTSRLPELRTNITQLKDLISKPISPSVCPSVVNSLLSYCYVCRLFNGEYESTEAIETLINKCPQLSHNVICDDLNKSLEMAVQQILIEQPLHLVIEVLRDVITLIKGPKIKMGSLEAPEYVLRVFSDIISIIYNVKKNISKQKRKDLKLESIAKKFEFYLSWSVPNGKPLNNCIDQINLTIDTLRISDESQRLEPNEDIKNKLKPKTLIAEIN